MKTGKPAPRIVIRPNCNFTGRGAVLLFLAMTLPVLPVAVAWALRGYWLILPFAGLELVILGIALGITVHRGGYREVIRFGKTPSARAAGLCRSSRACRIPSALDPCLD